MQIRDARPDDAAAIADIQNALLATSTIEWTDTPHTTAGRRAWLEAHEAAGDPVLVAEDDGEVVGFAAYSEFRDNAKWPGYRLTVENTIHVRESHWGTGVGRVLMTTLIERALAAGKHVMIAAVDGDNDASIRFHERLGFTAGPRIPQVGTKHGRWLDLVFLHLPLGADDPPGAQD